MAPLVIGLRIYPVWGFNNGILWRWTVVARRFLSGSTNSQGRSLNHLRDKTMWTLFGDMHSGGSVKVPPYELIYINAGLDEAMEIFQARFNRDPKNVTCDCCGGDYDITCDDTFEQLSGYHRKCRTVDGIYVDKPLYSTVPYQTVKGHKKRSDVLVINMVRDPTMLRDYLQL